MKKSFISILVAVLIMVFTNQSIYAASFSVSASASSITIGNKFQVYIRGQVAGRFNISTSNGSVSSSAIFIDNVGDGATITCTPSSVGTVTVTVTAADVTDASYQEVRGSSKVSVQVMDKATSTTPQPSRPSNPTTGTTQGSTSEAPKVDLKLSQLSFSVGELEPSFQPQIYEYVLKNIPLETTKTNINAKSVSSDVKITGIGTVDISSNKEIVINVKDNNSSQQLTYKIICKFVEKPILTLKSNQETKIGIYNDKTIFPTIEGFQDEIIKIDGKDIPVKRKGKLTLVYGVNEESVKDYYIYKEDKITSIYKPITLLGQNLVVVNIPKNKVNQWVKSSTIEIDKQKFECFNFKEKHMSNYCLLYFMDNEGNERFYQYDKTMNTLQIYSETIPLLEEHYNKEIRSKNILIYILSGVSLLLMGYLAFTFYHRKKEKI